MLSIANQKKLVANSLEMEGREWRKWWRPTTKKYLQKIDVCRCPCVCVCVCVGLSAAILKDPEKKTEGECGGMMLLCCLLHIWMPVYVIIYCWTHMPLLYIPCQCLPSPLLSIYDYISLCLSTLSIRSCCSVALQKDQGCHLEEVNGWF